MAARRKAIKPSSKCSQTRRKAFMASPNIVVVFKSLLKVSRARAMQGKNRRGCGVYEL
jgi:hypothetical protein